jgi:hypothetical protein
VATITAVKQHFTFEMYAPTSISESGVPIVDRVNVQMQGDDFPITDVIAKFEHFLRSCGYAEILNHKFIDLQDR